MYVYFLKISRENSFSLKSDKNNGRHILYYTILYYNHTILYYTILYYTILYYTILYYTTLYYTILYYTILHVYYTFSLRTTQMLTNKPTAFQISYRQSSENNTRRRNRHLVYTRTIHNRK